MSPTLAVRPMHPPVFETIPELAPVLEYYTSGAANTTSNHNSFSFSALSRHPQNTVGRTIRKRSSAVPTPTPTTTPTTTLAARSQLPPLNTALPMAYPMYPGLQTASNTITSSNTITTSMSNTATATTGAGSTAPPTATIMSRRGQEPRSLNRPRKISTSYSRNGSPSSPKCPSYETPPPQQYSSSAQQQQQQQYRIQYQSPTSSSPPSSLLPRPPQQQQKKPPPEPNALFGTLPGEVLEVVLEWLRDLHLDDPASTSCATCWARDLCSLCLASRKWSEVARLALYQDIRIVGDDSAAHRKRFKLAQGCRMTLLRRTLRANSRLAAAVRSLQLPMPVGDSCDATTPSSSSSSSSRAAGGWLSPKQIYENRVASLVMACPNLQVLVGPGPTHDHDTFNRITHALSTRTNLKTMNWRIGASTSSSHDLARRRRRPGSLASHRENSSGVFSSALACMLPPPPPPPPLLNAAQETSFLGHHRQWTDAFGDAALLSLPALRSLTLAHVPGVTAAGLSAFATRPNSQPLRSLQLRHTPLTSLPALARLLSHLPSLVAFALVQEFAPLMPTDDDAFALWMMPYLASRTLVRLHWDIIAHHHHHHHHKVVPAVSDADDILARSIEAGGFPALRTLRAPSDPDGIFQQLCRPREAIATSADRIWANGGRCGSSHGRHRTGSMSSSNSSSSSSSMGRHAVVPSLPKSATAASLPTGGPFAAAPPAPHGTDLRAARMAAQARLDDARPRFRFQVQVHSHDGLLVDDFGLGGYVGTVGSPIHYSLDPDWGSSDARGGLVDVSDLTGPGGGGGGDEEEGEGGYGSGGLSGCTGSWNWREGVVADKREKETWWHTERARWVRPRLD
ncbi:hypothetical protein BBO_03548 [Beauveria brongniartii RCEF 3172]|uniref:F-box domain-containing protein n=1 Tax=Beauveria brongniartii RCEF 3172 TaxID=1081107 RepID=A0A167FY73_9HYPO|nr:hypothetical protein BBO_03548 [Beauveria brongniartii RCEF 3172]